MATQYPAVVPSIFAGDATDFNKTKRDSTGAVRLQYTTVTVPDATTAGTLVGLVPFNKGFRMSYGSQLHVADLDTATDVTINVGYLYEDTTLTSDDDAFASALTTAQAGGLITFDEDAGLSWVAEGDGWIVVDINAGPTTQEGAVKGQILGVYDGLSASN